MESLPLHIEQLSEGRTGTALVCFHGFMGSTKDWGFLPSKVECPVYAVDLPGHGASGLPDAEGMWFNLLVDEVVDQLKDRGVSEFHVLGYSLGGRIALALADRYPDVVQKLVLESCHPGLEEEYQRIARRKNDRRWAERFASDWPSSSRPG